MQQSNVIVGALFIAFIIFITAKGELPVYIGFLRGTGAAQSANGSQSGMQQTSIGLLPTTIDGAQVIVASPSDSSIPQVNASDLQPSSGISVSGLPPLPALSPIGQ